MEDTEFSRDYSTCMGMPYSLYMSFRGIPYFAGEVMTLNMLGKIKSQKRKIFLCHSVVGYFYISPSYGI